MRKHPGNNGYADKNQLSPQLILSFKDPLCRACHLVFCAIDLTLKPYLRLRLLQWDVVACWPRIGFGVEPCCKKDNAGTDDELITLPLAIAG